MSLTDAEFKALRATCLTEQHMMRMEQHLNRIANVLERLESFFIATSVEEVQKRVEDMHNGRA